MRPPRGSQTASPDRCPWLFAPTPTVFRPPIHTPPADAPLQPDLPARPAPPLPDAPPSPPPGKRPVTPPPLCRRASARADQPPERPSRPFPRPPPSRHPFPSLRHLPSRARQLPPIRPAAPLRPRFPPLTAPRPARLSLPLLFDSPAGYGCCPQIRRLFFLHMVGTVELSRSCPQGRVCGHGPGWSGGWGLVENCYPQAVENFLSTGRPEGLSTGFGRLPTGRGWLCTASPQGCPLFGNETLALTRASERRHSEADGPPVGNGRESGDAAGDKSAPLVDGLCTTFGCPQLPRVLPRRRPQDLGIKNRL